MPGRELRWLSGAGGGTKREPGAPPRAEFLVVGQVAMALVLLVSAGLMIRTFEALRTVDPGFTDARHLQVMRISIPDVLVAEPERVTECRTKSWRSWPRFQV